MTECGMFTTARKQETDTKSMTEDRLEGRARLNNSSVHVTIRQVPEQKVLAPIWRRLFEKEFEMRLLDEY